LKADHAVVDFLLRDVLHDFFRVRRAHRKRAIAALPRGRKRFLERVKKLPTAGVLTLIISSLLI
jgi:hypothetical protein